MPQIDRSIHSLNNRSLNSESTDTYKSIYCMIPTNYFVNRIHFICTHIHMDFNKKYKGTETQIEKQKQQHKKHKHTKQLHYVTINNNIHQSW